MPPREMTATSLVPPPMSTTMEPWGSATGRPAPMAAAMGSSMMETRLAPACSAASRTARRSTAVTPEGIQMTTRGREKKLFPMALWINSVSMLVVTSKSAITPSFSGRTVTMEPGVRPMTSLASWPTHFTLSDLVSTATTLGSLMMMPLPFMYTRVFAVPKSMPISFENIGLHFLCAGKPADSAWMVRPCLSLLYPAQRDYTRSIL